ncbi:peptidylprolyl isomerase [Enemella evansiae]|nr:peptidylprolyl isomerase [Enemella evansiae]
MNRWIGPDRVPLAAGCRRAPSRCRERPKARGTVIRRPRGLTPAKLFAAPALAALLVLSACSGNQPADPASASPSAAPSAEATPTPATEPTPTPSASPTPDPVKTTPATNLDAIKVEGEPNKEPKVTFPAPWGIAETTTKVLSPGNGPKLNDNSTVEVNYYGVNGRTGQKFDDSFSRGQTATFPLGQVVPGFKKGLSGQQVGSRVLIAMPGKDGYDQAGGSQQAGIEVGDTLIFVVDIVATPLEAAQGEPVPPKEGLPTVEMVDNKPKVTIPAGAQPPAQLVTQPLIKGTGKPVQPSDTITARYQAVTWDDGKVVEDTYGKDPEQGPLTSLVPAWQEGLAGQPVGSRVLIVSPPDKAYPADPSAATPNPSAGKTVVYVIDILFATAGQ